jgi:uncharacterized membrane protein
MSDVTAVLLVAHVSANLIWIGSIVSVAMVLTSGVGSTQQRGLLAYRLYRTLATPAFILSFLAGMVMLALDLRLYFVLTRFMHAKLLMALIVIVAHHVLGARARAAASAEVVSPRPIRALGGLLGLAALLAVFLVVTKPF